MSTCETKETRAKKKIQIVVIQVTKYMMKFVE